MINLNIESETFYSLVKIHGSYFPIPQNQIQLGPQGNKIARKNIILENHLNLI